MNKTLKKCFGGGLVSLLSVLLFSFHLSAHAEVDVLRLLIWEGHAPPQHIKKFEEYIKTKYNRAVKLNIKYVVGSDDFFSSVRSRSVDLVMMTHHHFKDERFNYIKNKLLLPLDLSNIPNFDYVIPTLQTADYLSSHGNVYASPVSQGPYGLVYNTTLLRREPQSWNILWDPRFKKQYVIGANEYIYNVNITALAMGYPRDSISDFDKLNNIEFKHKLRQLTTNAHSFWIGVDKAEDLEGKSLATSWGDSLCPLNQGGESWKTAEPAEGTLCWVDNYSITWALKDKPFLKIVAEEYINGLLSTGYQVGQIIRKMSLCPVTTNINDQLTEEEKERIQLGTPNLYNENRILQHSLSRRNRNGLLYLWNEAMKGIRLEPESN